MDAKNKEISETEDIKTSTDESLDQASDSEVLANSQNNEVDNLNVDDEEDEPIIIPKIKQAAKWYVANRKKTLPITILFLLVFYFGMPATRYQALGVLIKRDFPIIIKDNSSNLPVSNAQVSYKGQTVATDGEGRATFSHVSIGYGDIVVKKPHYVEKQQRIALGLTGPNDAYEIAVEANGSQVPIQVINKITGERLAGVSIEADEVTATTDDKGEAVLVLPLEKTQTTVSVNYEGYNKLKAVAVVSQQVVDENTFELVPSGKIYFLSRRTGRINVMEANLDGSQPRIVVEATGNEDNDDTTLMATRDWRYLALKARREGKQEKLYLVDTQTSQLSEIEGADNVSIQMFGWSGRNFVYGVNRNDVDFWKSKNAAVKSFNADSQKINVIDENRAEGDDEFTSDYEKFGPVHIIGNKIIYSRQWTINSYNKQVKNKKNVLVDVVIGQEKQNIIREFELKENKYGYYVGYFETKQLLPSKVVIRYNNGVNSFYNYDGTELAEENSVNSSDLARSYPYYLESPGQFNTFWHEERDGKNTLFVGDSNGQNGKVIAAAIEYKPYGWFTDRYVLVSKNDNELHIMPSNGTGGLGKIIKITNYHRSRNLIYNNGGGYGGN